MFALGEWPPGFDLHPIFLQEPLGVDLLVERVAFGLVHRRRHVVVDHQVHQAVGREVTDPDGPGPPLSDQRPHVAPGAVHVPKGLMDQVQVETVQLQPLQ